ncbi:MAG: VOC family protein [Candidatus Methylomirabilia bacterium]
MQLDHIGLVTSNLAATTVLYECLGFTASPVREIEEQYPQEPAPHRYRAVSLRPPDGGPGLWVMEPISDAGPLARFLKRRGAGFHHLALMMADIQAEAKKLQAAGFTFIREPHDFPEGGELRGLLSPKTTGGVLIEIIQNRPRQPHA